MGTNKSGARSLHMSSRMKLRVAIVAVAVLVGCGVGMDDPEGYAAAGYGEMGQSSQHLTGTPAEDAQKAQTREDDGVPQTGGGAVVTGGSGNVSAPQDPIPAFEAKRRHSNPDPLSAAAAAAGPSTNF